MKTFILSALFISSAFAQHPWYSMAPAKIGDQVDQCVVMAQMELGRGSEPMLVALGHEYCGVIYKAEAREENKMVSAKVNGDSSVVNCLICEKPEGYVEEEEDDAL